MKKVVNPLAIMDTLLLDYVFNPLCWWSEYTYGKDAMHLRAYFLTFSAMVVLAAAVFAKLYVLIGLLWLFATIHYFAYPVVRRTWVKNNRTGKNIMRVQEMVHRTFDLTLVLLVLMMSVDNPRIFLVIIGSMGISICPGYFEATDALPPGYHRHKLAWNPL